MIFIKPQPIPNPTEADQLMQAIWQYTTGRRIGLFIMAMNKNGTPYITLGVSAPNSVTEEGVAELICDYTDGEVVEDIIDFLIPTYGECAAFNIRHVNRFISVDEPQWGWQRYDPLRGVYSLLNRIPENVIAGIGITLFAAPSNNNVPNFVVSATSFAVGDNAQETARKLASTYGNIGVKIVRPVMQRRTIDRMLSNAYRRPVSIQSVSFVSHMWHAPFRSDNTGGIVYGR